MEGANMEEKPTEIRIIDSILEDIEKQVVDALATIDKINTRLLDPKPTINEPTVCEESIPTGWFTETASRLRIIRKKLGLLNRKELSRLARAVDADKVVGKVEPIK